MAVGIRAGLLGRFHRRPHRPPPKRPTPAGPRRTHGPGLLRRRRAGDVRALLDLLASAARWHLLFGRRLIRLIETDEPDLQLPA
jgi:hypothetical protein